MNQESISASKSVSTATPATTVSGRFSTILQKVDSDASISEVRDEYCILLDWVARIAGHYKNVKLLARVRNLNSVLGSIERISEKKAFILAEIKLIEDAVTELIGPEKQPQAEKLQEKISTPDTKESDLETQIEIGLATSKRLADDIETVTAENNAMFESNKHLNSQYHAISQQHEEVMAELRDKQNKGAVAKIECNRLELEMDFLTKERARLTRQIDRQYSILAKTVGSVGSVKNNYEFTSGLTEFSEDVVEHMEHLLKKTINQKQNVEKKARSSEAMLKKLLGELNEIIKKGKFLYYKRV